MTVQNETELTLKFLDGSFCVHQISPDDEVPSQVLNSEVYFISRTPSELSIVCPADVNIPGAKTESGWACFLVVGPLDFSLTGILARISGVLADAKISIFAISTYDTDYLLVKETELVNAQEALRDAGYHV